MNTSAPREAPFFVGYINRIPAGLAWFLAILAAVLIGGLSGLALAIGATVNDPGDGRFANRQNLAGVMQLAPYPVLRLPPDAESPEPRTVLLSGPGKRGVQARAEPFDGQSVEAGGVLLKRGTIDMLQVGGNRNQLRADTGEVNPDAAGYTPADPIPLGRWRLSGEICDGKCYQGAMRPGHGLAHKACANLCLIGGAPPVFVSTAPVDGETFFLMAGADGGPLGEVIYDYTGQWVTVDGTVSRIDNLLIFAIDPSTLEVE